jgi:hypothetical protein
LQGRFWIAPAVTLGINALIILDGSAQGFARSVVQGRNRIGGRQKD